MANHCIDVVCAGCGRCWCLRGCGSGGLPNAKMAKRAQEQHAKKPGYVYSETCCPGFPVLSDSSIMGDKDPEKPVGPKTFWERIGEDP